MRSKHSISRKVLVLFAVLSSKKLAGCNPITNSNLNDHIREFSAKNDSINSTAIRTLQKEESERYGNFSPVPIPVRFKDASDSALSSSYSRGLLHHEHPGYTLHEYEESPPLYGYEYHGHGHGPEHHVFDHHAPDHYHGHHGGHHDIKYYHKHHEHALAAKAFLWPVAGIALLGAAAALVTNPVLLQLGVVSGRRRRRDTEELFDTQVDTDSWSQKEDEKRVHKDFKVNRRKNQPDLVSFYRSKSPDDEIRHRVLNKINTAKPTSFKKSQVHPTVQSPDKITVNNPTRLPGSEDMNENQLIPVPLILKEN